MLFNYYVVVEEVSIALIESSFRVNPVIPDALTELRDLAVARAES